MVMRESCANVFANFKAAVLGDEEDFWRRKGVVFRQLQDSMVKSASEIFFESQ